MPTPPSVPGVCRFRILGTLANLAPWGVRLYTAYSGPTPSNATMLTFAEDIAAAWNTHCVPFQSDTVTTTTCDGVDLSSSTGASATADVSYTGPSTNPAVANQVAAVVKYVIDRRYRGGKPKQFLPGIANTNVADDSHWTTSFVNAMGTAYAAFNTEIATIASSGTDLLGLVNVAFYHGFTPVQNMITGRWRNVPTYRGVPLVDFANSFTVDTLFGSQNRRRVN